MTITQTLSPMQERIQLASGLQRSGLFKDGTHKHGGTIYAVNVYADGEYIRRVTVGVVARQNDRVVNGYDYRWEGELHRVPAQGEDRRYLANDWTQPTWVPNADTEAVAAGREPKSVLNADKVQYRRTRTQAMAVLTAAADAITWTA